MSNSILITGASGLVGTRLTELLVQKGHSVAHLGRTRKLGTASFVWNIERGEIDPQVLKGVGTIIHLAGAGVADKRWTSKRKREIQESRTKSSALLFKLLENESHDVKTVASASAIGYYGSDDQGAMTEDHQPGVDYLAKVVGSWEQEVDRIASLGIRVVKIRTGIVLSTEGGALEEMMKPIKWGVGAPLGTGNQIMSWIHLDDLCAIFMKAIELESMSGVYNAVAPHPISNRGITKSVAKVLNRPLWLPAIPAVVLRLILGEMAGIVLNGSFVSSEKIQKAGFKFQFPELESALKDLFHR